METRKIYRSGNGLVVTLPREYLSFLHLGVGDAVAVELRTDYLVLWPVIEQGVEEKPEKITYPEKGE